MNVRLFRYHLLLFLVLLTYSTILPHQASAGDLYGKIYINNPSNYGYRRSLSIGSIGYSNTRRSTAAQRATQSGLFSETSNGLSASEQLASLDDDYEYRLKLWRWKKEALENAAAEGRVLQIGGRRSRGEPPGYGQQRQLTRMAKIYEPVPSRSSLQALRSVGSVSFSSRVQKEGGAPKEGKEGERKSPTVWDRFKKLF